MIVNKDDLEYKIKRFYELSLDELYEIARVRYEVFVCDQKITCENDFDYKDKECYHLIVSYKDKVVGYSRILQRGLSYEEPSIGRVLVLKEYRKNNIGQLMMERAVDFIVNELKEEEITISAQYYVKNLYENIGFKVVSEPYIEAEIEHVKMKYKK
jgi:ElaA protein